MQKLKGPYFFYRSGIYALLKKSLKIRVLFKKLKKYQHWSMIEKILLHIGKNTSEARYELTGVACSIHLILAGSERGSQRRPKNILKLIPSVNLKTVFPAFKLKKKLLSTLKYKHFILKFGILIINFLPLLRICSIRKTTQSIW